MSSQRGSFWGISQKARLGQLPNSTFTQLVIVAWDDLSVGVFGSTIVLDVFSGPMVLNNSHGSSHGEWERISFGHLGQKDEHNEASCVEVSDW